MDSCENCQHPAAVRAPVPPVGPGQPLEVWSGRVRHLDDESAMPALVTARLILIWRRSFSLELELEKPPYRWWGGGDHLSPTKVGIEFGGQISDLQVYRRTDERGWINSGVLGDASATAVGMTAFLTNFPAIADGRNWVHDHGRNWTWTGRWKVDAAGWVIKIDQVIDHATVFAAAREEQTYALTHTIAIARSGGERFDFAAAENIVYGLQMALSFAAGYWVGVICPTGHDEHDRPIWMQVGPPHNGRAQANSGWWNNFNGDDLAAYLRLFLALWDHPSPTHPLRSSVTSSSLVPCERVRGAAHHHRAVGVGDFVLDT